jgi:hypothetical protein
VTSRLSWYLGGTSTDDPATKKSFTPHANNWRKAARSSKGKPSSGTGSGAGARRLVMAFNTCVDRHGIVVAGVACSYFGSWAGQKLTIATTNAVDRELEPSAFGAVADVVGIEGGVVSGVINLETSGVGAPDWRPRHVSDTTKFAGPQPEAGTAACLFDDWF